MALVWTRSTKSTLDVKYPIQKFLITEAETEKKHTRLKAGITTTTVLILFQNSTRRGSKFKMIGKIYPYAISHPLIDN